jgi:hypothetical protein
VGDRSREGRAVVWLVGAHCPSVSKQRAKPSSSRIPSAEVSLHAWSCLVCRAKAVYRPRTQVGQPTTAGNHGRRRYSPTEHSLDLSHFDLRNLTNSGPLRCSVSLSTGTTLAAWVDPFLDPAVITWAPMDCGLARNISSNIYCFAKQMTILVRYGPR